MVKKLDVLLKDAYLKPKAMNDTNTLNATIQVRNYPSILKMG